MTDTNPFTDEYLEEELAFYGKPKAVDGVGLRWQHIRGRCDDYLNVNFRLGSPPTPALSLEDGLWMSLTFMEAQSMWVPIRAAHGRVAAAGLGLGYYVLRAAERPEVESVDVYERCPAVIRFFKANFASRSGFDKVRFHEGDARLMLVGKSYDFVYVDIYQSLCITDVTDDICHFTENNALGEARFWGQERFLYAALQQGHEVPLTGLEGQFFRQFIETELAELRGPDCDDEDLEAFLEALARW